MRQCPNCLKKVNKEVSVFNEKTPEPGDILVCTSCAQVCIYEEDLLLRKVKDDELKEISNEWPNLFKTISEAREDILSKNK